MDLHPYHFDLPDALIARYPVTPADTSRLLFVPAEGPTAHHVFRDLPDLLRSGDLIVFNRTRVSRRRLFLKRQSGAEIEVLFLEQLDHPSLWRCMARKAGRLTINERLDERGDDQRDGQPDEHSGARRAGRLDEPREERPQKPPVQFAVRGREGPLTVLEAVVGEGRAWTSEDEAEAFFEACGEPPIPPYLNRPAEPVDFERYQTIFAQKTGSVAAPTAGLHFTPELMQNLEQRFETAYVDLTIGYGTFAPLQEEHFMEKRLHKERFDISADNAARLQAARQAGRRIVAVGTTTLRALESVLRRTGRFSEGRYETDIFLHPPDRIQSCEALITNFHLPASSLFLLVCAFGGTERLQRAYSEAIENRYRFYSYGDAMLLEAGSFPS